MRVVFLPIFLIVASACAVAETIDQRAQAAVDRSRSTTAEYSVFTWNEANTPDRGQVSEWAAEFHRGLLHRVETPLHRIVADCGKMTGTWFDVATGKLVTSERVAMVACGVNANASVSSMRFIGQQKGRFGLIDRVELTDQKSVRTYDIDQSGALVAGTITGLDGTPFLTAEATARLSHANGDIFSEDSLQRSAVPDRYKSKPSRPSNN